MIRSSGWRALAVGLVAGVVLTGCELRPGAAAIVGEDRIASEELSDAVERLVTAPQFERGEGTDREALQRAVLTRLILVEIAQEAARRRNVQVTDGEVDRQYEQFRERFGEEDLAKQAVQAGIAPADLRSYIRTISLLEKVGDDVTADLQVPDEQLREVYQQNIANYDSAKTAHILVPTEKQARDLLAQVKADPSRFADLARQFSIDPGSKENGGDLGTNPPGRFVPEFDQAIFSAKTGDIVLARTEFGWHVIQVQERNTTTFEEAKPELRRIALQDIRDQRVQELRQETAADLGVTVNPRYGRWDPAAGAVLPPDPATGVTRPEPTAPALQPGDGGELIPQQR